MQLTIVDDAMSFIIMLLKADTQNLKCLVLQGFRNFKLYLSISEYDNDVFTHHSSYQSHEKWLRFAGFVSCKAAHCFSIFFIWMVIPAVFANFCNMHFPMMDGNTSTLQRYL